MVEHSSTSDRRSLILALDQRRRAVQAVWLEAGVAPGSVGDQAYRSAYAEAARRYFMAWVWLDGSKAFAYTSPTGSSCE